MRTALERLRESNYRTSLQLCPPLDWEAANSVTDEREESKLMLLCMPSVLLLVQV